MNTPKERKCEICGRDLTGRTNQRYCSQSCRQRKFRSLRSAVMAWVENLIRTNWAKSPVSDGGIDDEQP